MDSGTISIVNLFKKFWTFVMRFVISLIRVCLTAPCDGMVHPVIFLWRKLAILLFKKNIPKQHTQDNFLKIFQKTCHISKKKVMKSPRFLEDLGRFLAFFYEISIFS
jgi:hypothetical protein